MATVTFAEARTMIIWGFIGGMLPTLGKLAGTFGADFDAPLPNLIGVGIALALYGIIGGTIARGVGNSEVKQALFAGIAAPAIVISVITGVTDSSNLRTRDQTAIKKENTKKDQGSRLSIVSPARAEAVQSPSSVSPITPSFKQARPAVISWNVEGGIRLRTDILVFADVVPRDGSKPLPLIRARIGEFSPAGSGSLTLAVPVAANRLQFIATNGVQAALDLPPLQEQQLGWNIALSLVGRASVRDDFVWALGGGRSLDIRAINVRLVSPK